MSFETGRSGDENGLTRTTVEITTHWGSCLVGTTGDFEFVSSERGFTFANEDSIDDVADLLTQQLSMVVSSNNGLVGRGIGLLLTVLGGTGQLRCGIVDHCNK